MNIDISKVDHLDLKAHRKNLESLRQQMREADKALRDAESKITDDAYRAHCAQIDEADMAHQKRLEEIEAAYDKAHGLTALKQRVAALDRTHKQMTVLRFDELEDEEEAD